MEDCRSDYSLMGAQASWSMDATKYRYWLVTFLYEPQSGDEVVGANYSQKEETSVRDHDVHPTVIAKEKFAMEGNLGKCVLMESSVDVTTIKATKMFNAAKFSCMESSPVMEFLPVRGNVGDMVVDIVEVVANCNNAQE